MTGPDGQFLDGDADGAHGGLFQVNVDVALEGDVDLDGDVDFEDFLVFGQNYAKPGPFVLGGSEGPALWVHGDFDGDGAVAFTDFLLLSRNFGASA